VSDDGPPKSFALRAGMIAVIRQGLAEGRDQHDDAVASGDDPRGDQRCRRTGLPHRAGAQEPGGIHDAVRPGAAAGTGDDDVPPVITLNFGRELRPPGPAIEDSEHSMKDVTRKLLRRRLGMNQEPDASILCGCVRNALIRRCWFVSARLRTPPLSN
jgi:hypothetical protein